MEYDRESQTVAATRLPVPVISLHALLGLGGLSLWLAYLLIDEGRIAWISVIVLVCVAALGLTMAVRWVGVYRAYVGAGSMPAPPERKFPLPVVVAHGVVGIITFALVLVTALGYGGS